MIGADPLEVLLIEAASEGSSLLTGGAVLFEGTGIASSCISVRKLAKELQHLGHQVSHELVSELLHGLGYSLQALRKTREGGEHPDRDGQFEHLNAQAAAFLAAGEPAVSVDAKKKELVGDFKNPGREWHP